MAEMRCVGYYFVRPLPRPEWCTLDASCILSVSEDDIGCKFPDLTKCFWTNYPQSDRDKYAEYLGLDGDEFAAFCRLVRELFESDRISSDVRISHFEDAMLLGKYLVNVSGFRSVGLFTDSEIFSEFEAEGTFDIIKAGDDHPGGKTLGYDILGRESTGGGHFASTAM